jgi:hypothetical protein
MSARAEVARFILREALALGIRVGTDGEELVMLAPLRIPSTSRRTFETALENFRTEVIELVMRESVS